MTLYAGALAFNFVINFEQVPNAIGLCLNTFHLSSQAFLVIIMGAFLILGAIMRNIWPFILALVIALLLMVFVPRIVTWLPHHFGYL